MAQTNQRSLFSGITVKPILNSILGLFPLPKFSSDHTTSSSLQITDLYDTAVVWLVISALFKIWLLDWRLWKLWNKGFAWRDFGWGLYTIINILIEVISGLARFLIGHKLDPYIVTPHLFSESLFMFHDMADDLWIEEDDHAHRQDVADTEQHQHEESVLVRVSQVVERTSRQVALCNQTSVTSIKEQDRQPAACSFDKFCLITFHTKGTL